MKFIKQNWFNLFCTLAVVYFSIATIGANAATPVISSGEYKLLKDGVLVATYSNNTNAKSAQIKLASACKVSCEYVVQQPDILAIVTIVASSSSKASSSSSSSAAPKVSYVEAKCPTARVNGEALPFNQIGGYDLICDGRHEAFKSDSCDVSYMTSLPQLTKVCEIAALDTVGLKSNYVPVVR